MKAFFLWALIFVALLAAGFAGYGAYLNSRSAGYIASIQERKVIRVLGTKVEYRDMRKRAVLGNVVLHAANVADVVSQVEGDIIEMHAAEGQEAHTGQTLYILENKDLPLRYASAKADVAKNKTEFSNAASMLERLRILQKEKFISESDWENAVAKAQMAEAKLAASRAELDLAARQIGLQTVTAPMSGDILIVYHKQGAHVPYGAPLLLMGDFSRFTFAVQMPSSQLDSLLPPAEHYALSLDLQNSLKGFRAYSSGGYSNDTTFEARIRAISPPLGEPASFRRVEWSVVNHNKILKPGLYSGAVIRCAEAQRVLTAPSRTLLGVDAVEVFAVDGEGRLARRRVRIGGADDRYTEILEGLKEGDIAIESAVDDLAPGTAIAIDSGGGKE